MEFLGCHFRKQVCVGHVDKNEFILKWMSENSSMIYLYQFKGELVDSKVNLKVFSPNYTCNDLIKKLVACKFYFGSRHDFIKGLDYANVVILNNQNWSQGCS